MKTLLLLSFICSTSIYGETFKLPTGTTFRAHMDGFDCGTFGPESDYVTAPADYKSRNIEFIQLSADKELNNFLIELAYVGENNSLCTYGAFFVRNRDEVRLNLDYSEVVASGDSSDCIETQDWLNNALSSVKYQASKRGFRYVAVTLLENQENNICETNYLRAVFDRR